MPIPNYRFPVPKPQYPLPTPPTPTTIGSNSAAKRVAWETATPTPTRPKPPDVSRFAPDALRFAFDPSCTYLKPAYLLLMLNTLHNLGTSLYRDCCCGWNASHHTRASLSRTNGCRPTSRAAGSFPAFCGDVPLSHRPLCLTNILRHRIRLEKRSPSISVRLGALPLQLQTSWAETFMALLENNLRALAPWW